MSLDKKLKELLHDYKYQVEMNRDVYARLGNDEYLSILDTAIEAIKQAFIDEGWIKNPLKVAIHVKTHLLDHRGYKEYEQTWTPQTLVARNRLHKSLDARDKNFVEIELLNTGDDLMTGPEWLARSLTELETSGLPQDSFGIKAVRDALRRAAGVDHE